MNNKEIIKIISYWEKTAEHDFETMLSLYRSKRYSDSLFFGHIVIEKILKAHVVNKTKKHAPYAHDLPVLYRIVDNLELNEDEINLLDDVNRFNIRARYPDFKLHFYKLCTPEYVRSYLSRIKILYNKLCQKLKPKK